MEIPTSTKTSSNFATVHIEEGIYKAKLKEVKDISAGQYGDRVAFVYDVTVNEQKTVELALICYKLVATTENKIGRTLIAHGAELNDQSLNTNDLPNKEVRVWVEDWTKTVEKDGKKVEESASTINKVKPLVENLAHNVKD